MPPPVLNTFCANLKRSSAASEASKFWQTKQFCFSNHLTVIFFKTCLDKITASAMAGQNHFLPGQSDTFSRYFNWNEECKRRFHSDSYNSNLGSGHWEQFKEMTSEGQSFSIASGPSNNTNERKQLWAESHGLLESEEWKNAAWRKMFEE